MKVQIISPQRQEIIEDVSLIQLPGLDGLFEILSNHAPFIASLSNGKAKLINKKNETCFYPIDGGVVEVLKNKIIILTEKF
ncbi:MAG: F0F1 ATP synthase subunit epsilon [Bacteroidales bacterium]|nr:F0F1 ATP synthase subunit epsilon [Bacteroidales bacterium]